MTPQALFLYLSQTRHFSEDVAQEVVIDYLEGKMTAAKSLKAWASKRATWKLKDIQRRAQGRCAIVRQFVGFDVSPNHYNLRTRGLDPSKQAEARQEIDRYRTAHPEWDALRY